MRNYVHKCAYEMIFMNTWWKKYNEFSNIFTLDLSMLYMLHVDFYYLRKLIRISRVLIHRRVN